MKFMFRCLREDWKICAQNMGDIIFISNVTVLRTEDAYFSSNYTSLFCKCWNFCRVFHSYGVWYCVTKQSDPNVSKQIVSSFSHVKMSPWALLKMRKLCFLKTSEPVGLVLEPHILKEQNFTSLMTVSQYNHPSHTHYKKQFTWYKPRINQYWKSNVHLKGKENWCMTGLFVVMQMIWNFYLEVKGHCIVVQL